MGLGVQPSIESACSRLGQLVVGQLEPKTGSVKRESFFRFRKEPEWPATVPMFLGAVSLAGQPGPPDEIRALYRRPAGNFPGSSTRTGDGSNLIHVGQVVQIWTIVG